MTSNLNGTVYEIDPRDRRRRRRPDRPSATCRAGSRPASATSGSRSAARTRSSGSTRAAASCRRPIRGRRRPRRRGARRRVRLGRERGRLDGEPDRSVELRACTACARHPLRLRARALAVACRDRRLRLAALPQSRPRAAGRRDHRTGPHSELRKTVPITRRPGAEPRIVLSMGPGKLSGLRRRDRLELLSEVQLTVDCDKPSPRCAGRPVRLRPERVVVTLELAARAARPGRGRG